MLSIHSAEGLSLKLRGTIGPPLLRRKDTIIRMIVGDSSTRVVEDPGLELLLAHDALSCSQRNLVMIPNEARNRFDVQGTPGIGVLVSLTAKP